MSVIQALQNVLRNTRWLEIKLYILSYIETKLQKCNYLYREKHLVLFVIYHKKQRKKKETTKIPYNLNKE